MDDDEAAREASRRMMTYPSAYDTHALDDLNKARILMCAKAALKRLKKAKSS